jgi:hypothetical protein
MASFIASIDVKIPTNEKIPIAIISMVRKVRSFCPAIELSDIRTFSRIWSALIKTKIQFLILLLFFVKGKVGYHFFGP